MKIAIIGAGAIGGYVGAKLALAGEQITFLVRGANLAAIRANGIRLVLSDGTEQVAGHVSATDDYHAAGAQDIIILAIKAHQIEAVATDVPKLFGPDTIVVTMQNGFPYWYFHRHGAQLSQTFTRAGFQSPILSDIRALIWLKLWGNLAFNPISALARATLVDICDYAPTRKLAELMLSEAQTIAHKLNITFRVGIEQRIAGAEKVGKHKTSMLQDIEAGRAPEFEALVGSVVELGKLTQTPTPAIEAIYALVGLLARSQVP
jgi:ketopantoate reductase